MFLWGYYMAFYNRSGKKLNLDFDGMESLTGGGCSTVYHNEDIIFKKYHPHIRKEIRLTPEGFDFFKNINNPHFIKLYDIFCDYDFFELISFYLRRELFKVDGYTAKFYSDDSVNVLLEYKDYLLDNLRELEDLFNFFSDNRVYLDDIKRANTILGKNGIVIIDPDLFVINASLRDVMDCDVYSLIGHRCSINLQNKKALVHLINDIFSCCLYGMSDSDNYLKADAFFNFEIREDTDITSEVSKRLQYVKKPIDYIEKKN